jgi:hypothetical protein
MTLTSRPGQEDRQVQLTAFHLVLHSCQGQGGIGSLSPDLLSRYICKCRGLGPDDSS